jgi:hypothetical protein
VKREGVVEDRGPCRQSRARCAPRVRASVAGLATLLAAQTAGADGATLPPSIRVQWNAPSGCPETSAVRAAIAGLLGPSLPRTASSPIAAQATVRAAPSGEFAARILVQAGGSPEEKVIDVPDCATAADAFAMIVALAVDPNVGAVVTPPKGPAPPSGSPRPAQLRSEPPSRANPSPAGGLRALAGPLVATGAGALPVPSYGFGAKLALEGRFRWEVAAAYWPERPNSVASGTASVGARIRLESIESSFCLLQGVGEWCVAGEVGAMAASGTGVPLPSRGTSWWLAPSVAAGARWTVAPRIVLGARLDVGVPILRPSFVLDNVGARDVVQVYRPAPVFATVRLEAEFQFLSTGSSGIRHDVR